MSNLKDFRPKISGDMDGHVIPTTNAAYDFGSAEYKIRHLFLSDNSLWVGEHGDGEGGAAGAVKSKHNDSGEEIGPQHVTPTSLWNVSQGPNAATFLAASSIVECSSGSTFHPEDTSGNDKISKGHLLRIHPGESPGTDDSGNTITGYETCAKLTNRCTAVDISEQGWPSDDSALYINYVALHDALPDTPLVALSAGMADVLVEGPYQIGEPLICHPEQAGCAIAWRHFYRYIRPAVPFHRIGIVAQASSGTDGIGELVKTQFRIDQTVFHSEHTKDSSSIRMTAINHPGSPLPPNVHLSWIDSFLTTYTVGNSAGNTSSTYFATHGTSAKNVLSYIDSLAGRTISVGEGTSEYTAVTVAMLKDIAIDLGSPVPSPSSATKQQCLTHVITTIWGSDIRPT